MATPALAAASHLDAAQTDELREAIHAALTYADLFQFPLCAAEVHRFLPGHKATLGAVQAALQAWPSADELYFLPGRHELVAVRGSRSDWSRRLWPHARRYGRLLSSLPFVEMVGVSGSLAVWNARRDDDIDLMLVTRPGRLWTVRALSIGIVRLARQQHIRLCPNYLITSGALAMRQRNLFVAHELYQLVPLFGYKTYRALLEANQWARAFLPNAQPTPCVGQEAGGANLGSELPSIGRARPWASFFRRALERGLGGELGNRFEQWEAQRKIARFAAIAGEDAEVAFGMDECKGHFGRHGNRTVAEYARRVKETQFA